MFLCALGFGSIYSGFGSIYSGFGPIYSGFRCVYSGFGWVLDPGTWILEAAPWILDPGAQTVSGKELSPAVTGKQRQLRQAASNSYRRGKRQPVL